MPTIRELEATLTTAMGMGFNRVWAVFQPFTYSRTAMLFLTISAAF